LRKAGQDTLPCPIDNKIIQIIEMKTVSPTIPRRRMLQERCETETSI